MKCKFKFKNGKRCKYQAIEGKELCGVHDPDEYSVYFIEDCGFHEKNEFLPNISKESALFYINSSKAVRVDYGLMGKIEKNVMRGIKELKKRNFESIRDYISRKDTAGLSAFFGEKTYENFLLAKKFIAKERFTKKEREYLIGFINAHYKGEKNVP